MLLTNTTTDYLLSLSLDCHPPVLAHIHITVCKNEFLTHPFLALKLTLLMWEGICLPGVLKGRIPVRCSELNSCGYLCSLQFNGALWLKMWLQGNSKSAQIECLKRWTKWGCERERESKKDKNIKSKVMTAVVTVENSSAWWWFTFPSWKFSFMWPLRYSAPHLAWVIGEIWPVEVLKTFLFLQITWAATLGLYLFPKEATKKS